ncbi:autoinducer binding domain-containing protein [Sphingopyxis sp. DHUNG17]|uniref:helix-turn-helix transcriptional regulator n=1 Tax=Sphingopyxis jiangsuensis TaxID=2871171 RepID=UPI00191CA2FB|nr:LuxR family transcriptional regulator [Sphingopyxis lutea]MBL0770013.1 autoinducer binding domain-containing protein [Sphingopyxis lutea]
MPTIDAAHDFALDVSRVKNMEGLADLLQEACSRMGCSWFALSHHIDFLATPDRGIRVHNYPEEWEHWFDEQRLGATDPVHRESQRKMAGFLWHDMKTERPEDEIILAEARRHGIGDGLTVPAHLPGHAHGSVSFAWKPGAFASADALQFARMIGGPAFDAARLIAYPDLARVGPRLTRRQREVLIWAAKGETVRRIGLRLGLSPDTVREHLRNARQRYEANGGITLTVRALYDGDISFEDIAKR